MSVSSAFPVWVSLSVQRGRDLLFIQKEFATLMQQANQTIEVPNKKINLSISDAYFKSLFGVGLDEYVAAALGTELAKNVCADDEQNLRPCQAEGTSDVVKDVVPWRQWLSCWRGPKCLSLGCLGDTKGLPKVVIDGCGRACCLQCRDHATEGLESTFLKEDEGLWFMKYRRTMVPVLVCRSCGYGRPQSPEERWHGGIDGFARQWITADNQPKFKCGHCGGVGKESADMEECEVTEEHSSMSGTPLWQLKLDESTDERRLSADDGMPFTGWEWTSSEDVTFHDRVCVYYQRGSKKYFVFDYKTQQYIEQLQEPRLPSEHHCVSFGVEYDEPLVKNVGSRIQKSVHCRSALLKDLRKAGDLLKSPVPHLDRGCLFVLATSTRGPTAMNFVVTELPSRLLGELSSQRGEWSDCQVCNLLRDTITKLDSSFLDEDLASSEVCKDAHDGCSVSLVLLLGTKLFVAGLGSVQSFYSGPDSDTVHVLSGQHNTRDESERSRLATLGGWLDQCGNVRHAVDKMIYHEIVDSSLSSGVVIDRILQAPHSFAVLGFRWPLLAQTAAGIIDPQILRSAYRRQAVLVHPDKVHADSSNDATRAFKRLNESSEHLEELLEKHGSSAVTELCRVLTSASELECVGVDVEADRSSVANKVDALRQRLLAFGDAFEALLGLQRLQNVEHVILKRASPMECTPFNVTRAIGLKEFKTPLGLVSSMPSIEVRELSHGRSTLALLSPQLSVSEAEHEMLIFNGRPRAAWVALRQAQIRSMGNSSERLACICLSLERGFDETKEPHVKRLKSKHDSNEEKSLPSTSARVRHILFKHQGLTLRNPSRTTAQRRVSRTHAEAELEALSVLRILLDPCGGAQFPRLAREKSECDSAKKAGHLAGDVGWVSKRSHPNQRAPRESLLTSLVSAKRQDIGIAGVGVLGRSTSISNGLADFPGTFIEAALAMNVGDISDLVSTDLGVHIIQRLA